MAGTYTSNKAEQGGYSLHTVVVTVDASGDCTAYTEPVWGKVEAVAYVKTDYADGVDFTITGETTTVSLWTDTNINATETVLPHAVMNLNTSGAALTTHTPIVLAGERIKLVIASGGVSKVGTFKIIVKR
jgi:hypothetical protein